MLTTVTLKNKFRTLHQTCGLFLVKIINQNSIQYPKPNTVTRLWFVTDYILRSDDLLVGYSKRILSIARGG